MEYRNPGTRYKNRASYTRLLHQPYDYRSTQDGLLGKILPQVITNTTNPVTRTVLDFVESVFKLWLGYVRDLKNFKNWNYKPGEL